MRSFHVTATGAPRCTRRTGHTTRPKAATAPTLAGREVSEVSEAVDPRVQAVTGLPQPGDRQVAAPVAQGPGKLIHNLRP
jgi:hypothetical protein